MAIFALVIAAVVGVSSAASAAGQTIPVKTGSTRVVNIGGTGTAGSASLTYSLPKLPASGGGIYGGLRVRSNSVGAYVLQSRVYPDGTVQVSLKKEVIAGGVVSQSQIGSARVATAKAAAGSPIALRLEVHGTTTVELAGSVVVRGVTVSIAGSDADAPAGAGRADAAFYVSSSTPSMSAVIVSSGAALSTPATAAPAPTPTPTPLPEPLPLPLPLLPPSPPPLPRRTLRRHPLRTLLPHPLLLRHPLLHRGLGSTPPTPVFRPARRSLATTGTLSSRSPEPSSTGWRSTATSMCAPPAW